MPRRKERTPPPAGTTYKKEYKGQFYTLLVAKEQGRVVFKVGKETFRTPTAAAKAITRTEVNGWDFWGMDQGDI
jgi:hypothetical protein